LRAKYIVSRKVPYPIKGYAGWQKRGKILRGLLYPEGGADHRERSRKKKVHLERKRHRKPKKKKRSSPREQEEPGGS